MAVNKELWTNKIAEQLFPDNAFYRNSINDSAFVNGHSVHVPQAGSLNSATRDRSVLPAAIGQRTDTDNTYLLHEYSTDPVVVTNVEEVETTYDKFQSIVNQMAGTLYEAIGTWTVYEWGATTNIVTTSGTSRPAYASYQTGTRNALTFADILKAMSILNIQNVPTDGRVMVIDGYLYQDLLQLDEFKSAPTLMSGIMLNGAVGTIAGASVYVRTPSLRYDSGNNLLDPDQPQNATDNLGLLIYHPNFVRFALGTVEFFVDNSNPSYYGDIVSALARSGAVKGYTNETGVVSIVESV